MAESGIMTLSLKIAGDGFDDYYPYELSLEEGFSRVYRAELAVFTRTKYEQKDLKELLERKISLTINQNLAGGKISRQRYLHGIITGINNLGIVSRGENENDCFRHVITIESELARLRHTRLNSSYYSKTPVDIIEEILSRYGIKAEFSDKHINRSGYGRKLMFDQIDVSDLDFIQYIMGMYGISWTFVNGKSSQNGLGSAELHFSEGGRFPAVFYDYSDKRKIPEIEQFDFIGYDEGRNIWKMDGWQMGGSMGVEGMEVSAPYPEIGHGSNEWNWGSIGPGKRFHRHVSLFHRYERGTSTDEIDADIKSIIEAQRIALTTETAEWKGETENIAPSPGFILKLSHFNGPKDSAEITAMVTDIVLRARALWPRDLVSPPAGNEPGELAKLEFRAIDWGKDSIKRFCRITQKEANGR